MRSSGQSFPAARSGSTRPVCSSSPCLQPGQLPAQAGFAETGATLVADDAAVKADQDRSEDRATRPLRDVPDGRSGDPTPAIPDDPQADRELSAVGTASEPDVISFLIKNQTDQGPAADRSRAARPSNSRNRRPKPRRAPLLARLWPTDLHTRQGCLTIGEPTIRPRRRAGIRHTANGKSRLTSIFDPES